MVSRRSLLFSLAGAVTGSYGYVTRIEPRLLEATEKSLPIARGRLRRPLRILHLSDLHVSQEIPLSFVRDSFELGLASLPDLICLTGDFITTATDFDPAAYSAALRRLAAAAPVYAVFGNHDGGSWAARGGWFPHNGHVRQILEAGGATVLHNRSVVADTAAGRVRLAGLGDWWSEECDGHAAFAGLPAGEEPVICLNHNPDGKSECPAGAPWELMLCGHTHGGQIIIPFRGPAYVPILDKRFGVGMNLYDRGRWIHTTRGIGNISGFRLNCRPEVSTIVLT